MDATHCEQPLPAPTVFLAVSSLRAFAPVTAHLAALEAADCEAVLVSSFDLSAPTDDREVATGIVSRMISSGVRVVIDSGGYEAYWTDRSQWTADQHWGVVASLPGAIALGFDFPPPTGDTVDDLVDAALRGCEGAPASCECVIPIVHAPSGILAETISQVARRTQAYSVAVPEKRLGSGLIQRMSAILDTRSRLDEVDASATGLHILGAGAPLDVVCYTLAGARSFDGLEWSRALLTAEDLTCRGASEWELLKPAATSAEDEIQAYLDSLWIHNMFEVRRLVNNLRRAPKAVARETLERVRPRIIELLDAHI